MGWELQTLFWLPFYINEFLDQYNAFLLHETAAGKFLKVMKHLSELYWKVPLFALNESVFWGTRRHWSNIDDLGTSFGISPFCFLFQNCHHKSWRKKTESCLQYFVSVSGEYSRFCSTSAILNESWIYSIVAVSHTQMSLYLCVYLTMLLFLVWNITLCSQQELKTNLES